MGPTLKTTSRCCGPTTSCSTTRSTAGCWASAARLRRAGLERRRDRRVGEVLGGDGPDRDERQRGRPGRDDLGGTPIDLTKVTGDSFDVGRLTDRHHALADVLRPDQLLDGAKEVSVVSPVHPVVRHPARTANRLLEGRGRRPHPDAWLTSRVARRLRAALADWLLRRSREEKRRAPGSATGRYPPLGPAPGTYPLE